MDTTRADALHCYGDKDMQTPILDGLASQGALFSQSIATSQGTNPSHASLLTGLYVSRHRVVNNRTLLAEEAVTLAEVLAERGYRTLAAVSVRHLDAPVTRLDQGFEEFLHCEDPEIRAGTRNDDQLLDRVRELASGSEPFFAWVHYYDPHGSYRPPPPHDTLYPIRDRHEPMPSTEFMDIDDFYKAKPVFDPDTQIALYHGEVSYMDSEIGRLLDSLGAAIDHTAVIAVADHGESFTEHDVFFCHRGLFNESIHVPMVIRYPSRIPAGSRVDQRVSGVDIFPTVLDLLDIDAALYEVDGASLLSAFEEGAAPLHEAVYSESVAGGGRAVYVGDFKYIKQYGADPFISGRHLYEVSTDWTESADLLEQLPDTVRQLDGTLERWYGSNKVRQLPSREPERLDPKTEEALRQLGYVD